jgi:CheY-like chemotaxis protein
MRRLLVIDDDPGARLVFAEHFKARGYRVETAGDGNEGISRALRTRPDIMIVDLVMPRLDGYETTRLLRTYRRTRMIPIIVCTGTAHESALARAMRVGCDAIVAKPCLFEELDAAIERLLGSGLPDSSTG